MSTTTTTRRGRKPANKTAYAHDEPLMAWPSDWDSRKHKPLEEEDFHEDYQWIYWEKRAEKYKERMLHAEQQAELCRTIGGKEAREKAAKIVALKAKIERYKAELGEDIDVSELAQLFG